MASVYETINNTLLLQLAKLQDCSPDELEGEIARSKEVAHLAGKVIDNQSAAVDHARFLVDIGAPPDVMCDVMRKQLGSGE